MEKNVRPSPWRIDKALEASEIVRTEKLNLFIYQQRVHHLFYSEYGKVVTLRSFDEQFGLCRFQFLDRVELTVHSKPCTNEELIVLLCFR